MAARKPKAPGPRSGENARSGPSGPNIPDDQRHTIKRTLRLPPDDDAALEALAVRWGLTLSATVARLVAEAQTRGD